MNLVLTPTDLLRMISDWYLYNILLPCIIKKCLFLSFFLTENIFWIFCKKMPSGLRRYTKNRKDPSSNPTRHSTRLWDPTWLCGCWWPLGWIKNPVLINIGLVRLPIQQWTQVGCGVAVKNKKQVKYSINQLL